MVRPVDGLQEFVKVLERYSACDISDALLRLKVPGAGFVPDLFCHSLHQQPATTSRVMIAPASTVLFAEKDVVLTKPAKNVPEGSHWADLAEPGSVVFLRQPDGQTNAVCGGIMALRMKVRGVKGIVTIGRVRDVDELRSTGLPIWAQGTSAVGAGGRTVPWALQVPLNINGGTVVHPGDLVFCDLANGVVVIPRSKVQEVVELLPRLVDADDGVKQAVEGGMSVYDAFKIHRSNL